MEAEALDAVGEVCPQPESRPPCRRDLVRKPKFRTDLAFGCTSGPYALANRGSG